VGLVVNVKIVGEKELKKGTILYMGAIPELPKGDQEDLWLGVGMEEPLGKHDGMLGERRVFQCAENCGVFVMRRAVSVPGEESPEKKSSRKRSRSRSRRRRSRSRSKSAEREPRKKSGFGDTGGGGEGGAPKETAAQKVERLLAGIEKAAVVRPEDEVVYEITDRFHPTRKQRRLYICNLPTAIGLNEDQVTAFFNIACREAGCVGHLPGDPIIGTWLSEEKVRPDGVKFLYGFLEFRTVEETTRALALNGIVMQGLKITVRRPNDYEPPKDSKGLAVQGGYQDLPAGPNAGLNMAVFGNNNNVPDGVMGQTAIGGWVDRTRATPKEERPPTTALLLENMVTKDELVDDETYADIVLDTKEECEKFGEVKALEIPRPIEGQEVTGVGKVYILFGSKEACIQARETLHGRAFDGRTVFASFCDDSPGVLSFLFKDFIQ